MKKALLTLSFLGVISTSLLTASAQYYNNPGYTNTGYGSNYYYNNSYNYYGGIASYSIGCTTFYYNPRTHQQLYTENICNNYDGNYYYQYQYSYPSYYSYPYYYNYSYYNNYCTYRYSYGGWYNSCGW